MSQGKWGDRGRVPGARLYLLSLSLIFTLLVVTAGAAVPEGTVPDLSAYPWLYLRDGQPLAAGERAVEVIAVGDLMLGRGVADVTQPFDHVASWLRSADLAVGNLECVVAEGGTRRPGPFRFRAPLSAIAALRDAGFDVLGLANNHALDYGPAGLAETVSRLQAAGIETVGAGSDAKAAYQPLIREVDGLRLAFLAFNAVPDPEDAVPGEGVEGWTRAAWDPKSAVDAVAASRTQADAVLVSIHWGYEYDLRPDPAQRDAARALLDAGADLVVGHHPHVVQKVEADGFAAYSLGNFVFDQQQGETRQGLALRVFFDRQGLRAVQALPLWAGPHPRLMSPDEAYSLLARVQPATHRDRSRFAVPSVAYACDDATCRPVDLPHATPLAPVGAFRSGETDLTGDGLPEQVRLEQEQVVVYGGDVETWRGLPQWRVVDLALGDPNDDGRAEMLLALWKPDEAGVPRSHPFVVGYRGGSYRILWGGSAVADRIHEVELGDLDGDGVQELIVLAEQGGARAIAVWRWHGWGFSLLWRSPPGDYHDLALIPDGEQGVVIAARIESRIEQNADP